MESKKMTIIFYVSPLLLSFYFQNFQRPQLPLSHCLFSVVLLPQAYPMDHTLQRDEGASKATLTTAGTIGVMKLFVLCCSSLHTFLSQTIKPSPNISLLFSPLFLQQLSTSISQRMTLSPREVRIKCLEMKSMDFIQVTFFTGLIDSSDASSIICFSTSK